MTKKLTIAPEARRDIPSDEEALRAVETLLLWIGENPEREGLRDTPERLLKAWRNDYFCGYQENSKVAEVLSQTFSDIDSYGGPVMLRGIEFYSTCEHHLAPIRGTISLAYTPRESVVGLSKAVRLCDIFTRRMQTQERMTMQVAHGLRDHLNPRAVAVVIEAEHFCMAARGVHRSGVMTQTEIALAGEGEPPAHAGELLEQLKAGVRNAQETS